MERQQLRDAVGEAGVTCIGMQLCRLGRCRGVAAVHLPRQPCCLLWTCLTVPAILCSTDSPAAAAAAARAATHAAAVCVQRAVKAQPMQLGQFHSADYIDFLARVTPDNQNEYGAAMGKHNFNEDCPVFDGLFEYCRWAACSHRCCL